MQNCNRRYTSTGMEKSHHTRLDYFFRITQDYTDIIWLGRRSSSFKKLDESNNLFNPINIEDLNNAQKDLKEKVIEQSKKKGVLKVAKNNAETLITGMLSSVNGDYKIKIEWK